MPAHTDITRLLKDYGKGSPEALKDLATAVYAELRKIAANHLRKERSGHTLQPTALVNEAFVRLLNGKSVDWNDRAHFFAVAATVMRRILIDHAKARLSQKRGGNAFAVSFQEAVHGVEFQDADLIALHDALTELSSLNQRQSQIVELRFFGGLDIEETAAVLSCSPATIKREWTKAKIFLFSRLKQAA